MKTSLYDRLFIEIENESCNVEQDNKCLSIKTHLFQLLNTRQGSLMHMPDYGLPDVNEIYHSLPYSVHRLLQAVARIIEKYEPRLQEVHVRQSFNQLDDSVLSLTITGKLPDETGIAFDTHFMCDRRVGINDA